MFGICIKKLKKRVKFADKKLYSVRLVTLLNNNECLRAYSDSCVAFNRLNEQRDGATHLCAFSLF